MQAECSPSWHCVLLIQLCLHIFLTYFPDENPSQHQKLTTPAAKWRWPFGRSTNPRRRGCTQQSCRSHREKFKAKATEMRTPAPTWTNPLTPQLLLSSWGEDRPPGLSHHHPPSTLTESFCAKFGPGTPRSSKHRLLLNRKFWLIAPPGCRSGLLVAIDNGLAIYSFNPVQHLWNILFLLLWSKCKYYLAKGNCPQGKSSSEQFC